jgi:hypothetical protein
MTTSARPFDHFVAIDWSGARAVQTKAIAVAEMAAWETEVRLVEARIERQWSRTAVARWLVERASHNERSGTRALVGIDANVSYGSTFFERQLPTATNAAALWAYVEERAGGAANFSGEAIWQHPDLASLFWSSGQRPIDFKPAERLTEAACQQAGLGRPETPFKLIGPAQVGKGGLAVMRLCHHLRSELGDHLAVWPFDPPQACATAAIVLVEIYPRLFIRHAGHGAAKIRLAERLRDVLTAFGATCRSNTEISDHDADALIAAAGMRQIAGRGGLPLVPPSLAATIRREGWIFGLPFPDRLLTKGADACHAA